MYIYKEIEGNCVADTSRVRKRKVAKCMEEKTNNAKKVTFKICYFTFNAFECEMMEGVVGRQTLYENKVM